MRFLLAITLALTCIPACAAEPTPQTLPTLIKQAAAGASISLKPGRYGDLRLSKSLIIKGSRDVIFKSITIAGASGVRLEGFSVEAGPLASHNGQAVRVFNSSDVVLSNLRIVGGRATNGVVPTEAKLDASRNVLGLPAGKGINVHNARNVTIVGCEITLFHKGLTFANVQGLKVLDNDIHDLRTSPISGGGVSEAQIMRNHSWSSTPWSLGGAGDHGDMVHLWTAGAPSQRITIADNLFEQGQGAALLGIYLDDNKKGFGFTDVQISGNVLVNSEGQGIRLENVLSGAVVDNQLLWSGGGDWKKHPRIGLHDSTAALRITGNRTAAITGNPRGNRLGPTRVSEARAAVQSWMLKHRPTQLSTPHRAVAER